MSLKAVFFDFNGTIINDEGIHEQLICDLLLGENLRPSSQDYREVCLGRSDRACLQDMLERRGRVVSEDYLAKLIEKKSQGYPQQLEALEELPIYPGLADFLQQLQDAGLVMGIVTGAVRSEVDFVLDKIGLGPYFSVLVTGEEVTQSKPYPYGYFLAVERVNLRFPQLGVAASDCLAIEDSPAGIEAAKNAGMQVVGMAHSYPFHMIQRQAHWTVDYFREIELERIQAVFST
ncbi:HAD family phosphatase [Spirulina sp. CS-785/01]|uniref:HAD family hydrolase n=1 Tax=Spirulina sp. CS-785/01 TaxID=3021716 RepID=UPI00232A91BC|nr:HAD family phosphatase [Spirulina sp. CS-785/01]MDB9315004.1 HAD family phosphatase [Spirulina sp. CS-785/01]